MDNFKVIEKGDLRLTIMYDQSGAGNPRDNDNLGKLVTWHKRYSIGHEQPKESPEEFLKRLGKNALVLPVFMYDHSGIALRTRDFSDLGMHGHFDSGQLGYIYATHEKIKEAYGSLDAESIAKASEVMEAELKSFQLWVNGQVFGYVLERITLCPSCGLETTETLDSCWGFVTDDPLEDIKTNIDPSLLAKLGVV